MSDIKNITYLQDQLAASKAENQALAEALRGCLPLIDGATRYACETSKESHAKGDFDRADKWAAEVKTFVLQANHIRSLLGLPQLLTIKNPHFLFRPDSPKETRNSL